LEKTDEKAVYSGGRVALGLDFSVSMARLVAVVRWATRGDPLGIKREPHLITRQRTLLTVARLRNSGSVSNPRKW
jgi:hypothetical protein